MCLNHARLGRDDLIHKVTFEQQFEGVEGVDPDRGKNQCKACLPQPRENEGPPAGVPGRGGDDSRGR